MATNPFGRTGKGAPQRPGTLPVTPPPSADQGGAERRSEVYTTFTKADGVTHILYNGDRLWAKVTVELETAGPVSVGTAAKLTPVLGGSGVLLQPDLPKSFTIAKGSKLSFASTSVNRVAVSIEPLPWLEQIAGSVRLVAERLERLLSSGIAKLMGR